MKYRTTKKDINSSFNKIICVNYGKLANLLTYEHETAYTAGVYGWNADLYEFGPVAVVTGYRPFGNIKPDYETTKKYENMAREIIKNIPWNDQKNALHALIENFIEEVITK